MSNRWNNAITDVPGIKVGHATNEEALTGCTVVLCEVGVVGGYGPDWPLDLHIPPEYAII